MQTLEIQRLHGGLAIITNPAMCAGAMCQQHAPLRVTGYVGSSVLALTIVVCSDSPTGSIEYFAPQQL
jgi:hypothetical protein